MENVIDVAAAAQDQSLLRHIENCVDCRRQLAIERRLSALYRGMPRGVLSPSFRQQLRQRLAAERKGRRAKRRLLLIMQIYWVLALAASATVLLLIRWPQSTLSAPLAWTLCLVIGVGLSAPLILLHSLRVDLIGLIAATFRPGR